MSTQDTTLPEPSKPEELMARFQFWYGNDLLAAPVHQSREERQWAAFQAGAEAQAAIAAQAQQPATVKDSLTPQQAQQAQGVPSEVLSGWKFNHAQQQFDEDGPVDGVWEIGFLDPEDDRFSPIITIDTGLYYQGKDAEPMAKAILARLTASNVPAQHKDAAPQAEPPASAQTDHIADASKLVEPHVWLFDFMDGATTVRNWSTTNKAEAFAPGNFNQRGYVPAEN